MSFKIQLWFKVEGMKSLVPQSQEVLLDCLREPNGLIPEERELKPSPPIHLLPSWQGFQAVQYLLRPNDHCSHRAQRLSPYLSGGAPTEANKTFPCNNSQSQKMKG